MRGKQTANCHRHSQDYTGALAGAWIWEKKCIAMVKEHRKAKNLMLIVCIMIIKFKTVVKGQE